MFKDLHISVLIVLLLLSVGCCSKEEPIELTPDCLISLNSISNKEVSEKLKKQGWTRHSDGYKKSGISGMIRISGDNPDSDTGTVDFVTQSGTLYQQWVDDLKKKGYTFKDVTEFEGLYELLCEKDDKTAPSIKLERQLFYEDAKFTKPTGECNYSMYYVKRKSPQ